MHCTSVCVRPLAVNGIMLVTHLALMSVAIAVISALLGAPPE
jgi:hypothetical protein